MSPRHNDDEPRASLLVTLALMFLLVNFILWGVAVAMFHGGSAHFEGAPTVRPTRGVLVFVLEAVTAVPQIGSVIPYVWSNHLWYVGVVGVLEVLLLLLMLWMKKVDQDLRSGSTFGKRKR